MSTFTQMAENWIRQNHRQSVPSPEASPCSVTLAQVDLLPAEIRKWDDAMLVWVRAHCAFRERSWGIVSSLYVNHIEWAHETDHPFAADRETFQAILMGLGFQIADGMCYGLILKEDCAGAHHVPEPLKATPARNH